MSEVDRIPLTGPVTTGSARPVMGAPARREAAGMGRQIVIEDAHEPGSYLGVTGWTTDRGSALEFATPDDARDMLAQLRRDRAAMFAGKSVDIVARKFDPEQARG